MILDDLILPPALSNAGFVSPDLDPLKNPGLAAGNVSKSGYNVLVGAGTVGAPPSTPKGNTCNLAGNDAIPTYFASAAPNAFGSTGTRSFGTDQRATIYQDTLGAAWDANRVSLAPAVASESAIQ